MNTHKETQTSRDMRKLNKIMRLIPEERRPIAEKLLCELVFMSRTLEELKATVESSGATSLFKQGKQEFMRESPALKAYNTTIQRYSLLYRQLTDLLPKTQPGVTDSELMTFLKQR